MKATDRRAAQWFAVFLVICIAALFLVDELPLPQALKTQLKRVLWTAILASLAVVLLGVAALGMPWAVAGGLAVVAFAGAGGVWALGSIGSAAAGGGGAGGAAPDEEVPCEPGSIDPVTGGICLGLEY
jgi:hypothetical protein